jgi:arylformamidase
MLSLAILMTLAAPWQSHAQAAPAMQQTAGDQRRMGRQGNWGGARASQEERRGNIAADQRLLYGSDARQRILFFRAPDAARRPPLAVFVHGGGWQNGEPEMVAEKPAWFRQHGWAFASVGYRLLPDAPVEQQAADIGAALRHLREAAGRLGYDPDRILLLGHSAGAHLTALVSTDPQYAGSAFAAIRGALLIDGAGYDVAAQMQRARFMARRTYLPVFGTDPARQRALSPVTHVGGRDAPDWLILYARARDDAAAQSQAMGQALQRSGVRADVLGIDAGDGQMRAHMAMNIAFGTPGYGGNDAVLAQMRRVAAQ